MMLHTISTYFCLNREPTQWWRRQKVFCSELGKNEGLVTMVVAYQLGNTRGVFFKHPRYELISSKAQTYDVKFVLSSRLACTRDV